MIHLITADQVDKDLFYTGPDLSNFDGDIQADPDLGRIRFKDHVVCSGSIFFAHKTGITTEGSIVASNGPIDIGCGIRAMGKVSSGSHILAGAGILAGNGLFAQGFIKATQSIISWGGIRAGNLRCGENIFSAKYIVAYNIQSSRSIRAGEHISCGGDIRAALSIHAGLNIDCNNLYAGLRIFAGICSFHLPSEEEQAIRCKELKHGQIAHGKLYERAPTT